MNAAYSLDAELYLPFRYNLVLKVALLAMAFSPALPLLLPFAALFLGLNYAVDRCSSDPRAQAAAHPHPRARPRPRPRYNLLRVLKPPPRTSDLAVTTSVLYILPIACCLHIFYALFFYSKQVAEPVIPSQ